MSMATLNQKASVTTSSLAKRQASENVVGKSMALPPHLDKKCLALANVTMQRLTSFKLLWGFHFIHYIANHVIYVLFFMLLLISLITSIGSARYTDSKQTVKEWWYLKLLEDTNASFDPDKPLISGFLQFLRALILYGYLIPISLYVSIEVVKFLQAMLINNDLQLFDEMSGKSV
ncbi:unnamed protein product [Lactuca virosa]|uniref:Uncharacterized protein n=1 Tax=Lactuca virosa TaxID=75947 RepID=A0AAU9NWZ1_9ASTR|nr:unnamed protein product [Lactuca virosa]